MSWISVKDHLPELKLHNYFSQESDPVLATDGKVIFVAYFLFAEGEFEAKWKKSGRDFYDFYGVTHWMPLPKLP